jgi:hypothetical protein
MDTDLPLFDFVKKSPEMTKQFAGYMRNVQSSEKTHIRHLVSGYDWKSLGNAVVVDVCNVPTVLINDTNWYSGWWINMQLIHSPGDRFSQSSFRGRRPP